MLAAVLPASAGTSTQDEKRNYFDKWKNVPSVVLMHRGRDVINRGGNMDSALIYYNVVYNRYVVDPGDKEKAQRAAMALNNMGYLMFFDYFDYERSYSYLSQSLEMSEKYGLEENLPYVYVNLGNLILTQRGYINPAGMKDALPYYKQGFYIAARRHDWNIMLINFTNMVGMANSLDAPIPFDSIRKEIAYFDKLRIPANTNMLGYARQDVRVCKAMAAGKYREGIALCEVAIAAIPDSPDSLRYVLNSWAEQAAGYMRLKQYGDAYDILVEQLQVAKNAGIKDIESEIYLDLMIISRKMGKTQQAEHYEYLYLKSKDDMLFGSHKMANVERSRFMQQLQKANEEVRESARHRHRTMVIAIVAIAFVIIIAGFSIIVVRKNRRLRENNHRLFEQVQEAMRNEEANGKEQTGEAAQPVTETKYKNSNLDDKRREEIVGKIEAAFADKRLLCDEDMSLTRLSEIIGTPYKPLSQAINEHWQKNFSQLLSEYRIHEACRRMQNKAEYGNYTIEAIGNSVGFHTRSNFVTTFKRITGLTPSEYIHETEQKDR